ncbi:TetR/AcrR family transcriptional regulator [Actinoplanes auranticolor]|uniref:TetR/AcrR family transcriptional regulator n=1 Tax=Actinoplanes auranticolor TaxID=47988 RepID=UPI001BB3CB28|nr:TetR/AcrR family transcriptional regulator [Actinoplanes auranticolor]
MGRPRGFDEDEAVRAAVGLFGRQSFAGTSVDDLVSHLGVHRGSLYKTFGSKRGLYLAALRQHVDRDVAAAAEVFAATTGIDAAVHRIATAGPDLGLLLLALVERAPVDPEVAVETSRALARLRDARADLDQALGLLLRTRAIGPAPEFVGE